MNEHPSGRRLREIATGVSVPASLTERVNGAAASVLEASRPSYRLPRPRRSLSLAGWLAVSAVGLVTASSVGLAALHVAGISPLTAPAPPTRSLASVVPAPTSSASSTPTGSARTSLPATPRPSATAAMPVATAPPAATAPPRVSQPFTRTRYEAEASSTVLPNTEHMWTGYSGSGYLCCWDENGQYATFNVTVPSSGTYSFALGYSAGAGSATRKLTVDGTTLFGHMSLLATPDWNSWTRYDFAAHLNAGQNTVTVSFDTTVASSQFVNLDYLEVAPPTSSARYEAESAATNLSNTEHSWTGYSGDGYICCWNQNGDYVTFTVSVAASGQYNLGFRYSATSAAHRKITVNGATVVSNEALAPTATWDTWATATVRETLHAGTNTVTMSFDSAAGSAAFVNLDFLDVTP